MITAPPAQTVSRHWWWDAFCIASLVGIWPRFIEPRLVMTNVVTLKLKELPPALSGLKILHFSDLHLNAQMSDVFLDKLCRKAALLTPDLVVFTGDFLCHSRLDEVARLRQFLCRFPEGKYGSFAVLGNHDYRQSVSVDDKGEYAVYQPSRSPLGQGMRRLFRRVRTPIAMQLQVREVPMHDELVALLAETPFRLLHNQCCTVAVGDSALNICGLGEYLLGRCDPAEAFRAWDNRYPGLVLAHNPDCVPLLDNYPGALILSGHTHGGQVNLPGLASVVTTMEQPQLKRGLVYVGDRWVSISRGVGGLIPFRWFSPPELLCLTLKAS